MMVLFLRLDFSRFRSYAPLYLSGKCISLVSMIVWFSFSHLDFFMGAFFKPRDVFIIMGILGIMLLGDLFSAAAGLFLAREVRDAEGTDSPAENGGA
jgi:hypothetical protein